MIGLSHLIVFVHRDVIAALRQGGLKIPVYKFKQSKIKCMDSKQTKVIQNK